jgi:hypothetical protein
MSLSKVIGFAAVVAALALAATGGNSATAGAAKTCPAGYVHAKLSWGEKCLKAGQYCKIKGDREYHRYHFHCHTGRLSRSAAGGNSTGSGCQPGYSPCLPRVADLNCSDIPASKKPIRVTGDDPYRLDGDGDGWAASPRSRAKALLSLGWRYGASRVNARGLAPCALLVVGVRRQPCGAAMLRVAASQQFASA